MSAKAIEHVRAHWRGLAAGQRMALLVIADHWDDKAKESRVKRSTLAFEYGASQRSLWDIVNSLIEAGWVVADRAHGRATRYLIHGLVSEAAFVEAQRIAGKPGHIYSGEAPLSPESRDGGDGPLFDVTRMAGMGRYFPKRDDTHAHARTSTNAGGLAAPPHPLADAGASMSVNNPTKSMEDIAVTDTNDNGRMEEKGDESVVQAQFEDDEHRNDTDNGERVALDPTLTRVPDGVPDFESCMASWDAVA